MRTYAERKNEARRAASYILEELAEDGGSFGDYAEASAILERIARRFGLIREFKEMGGF